MSTGPIEVADEAIKNLDKLTIVDDETKDKAEKTPRPPRISEEERRRIWEEKQAKKKVLETEVTGKVKWYSVRGKYGFIARTDEKNDVFVHQTAILKSPMNRFFLRTLADGEDVVFNVVEGDKGPEAANVTGPDGADVKGSRFFHVLLRSHITRRKIKSEGDKNGEKGGEKNSDAAASGDKPKKQRRRFPRRKNGDKKTRGEKKTSESKSSAEEEEEKPEKAGRRRRASNDSEKVIHETKVSSPKGSGDASLGAQPAAPAAVH